MTDDDVYRPTWADMERVADRCERAAATLADTADNAAEILPTRACGDLVEPATWALQKRRAAGAARAYAAELRDLIATRGTSRPDPDRYGQAELVATAAECDGILIDGRPTAERSLTAGRVWVEPYVRQQWAAGKDPTQVKARAIESTGLFVHIADTIDGVAQVPFWRLVGRAQVDAG